MATVTEFEREYMKKLHDEKVASGELIEDKWGIEEWGVLGFVILVILIFILLLIL